MQQKVIITLDQDSNVFLSGVVVGQGEMIWEEAMKQIPLSRVEEVVVRDETNPYSASEWRFSQPYAFSSLREAIEWYPPIVYSIEYDAEQSELRREELATSLEPDIRSKIESRTAEMAEEREKSEDEPEHDEADEDEELEEVEEIEFAEPLPDAEFVDWEETSGGSDTFKLKEDFEFKSLQERGNFVGLPRGMKAGQVYLPGERLSKTPLAVKRQKLKVNKQKSKVPYYMGGILILMALIVFGVRWISTPDPTQYQAICVDYRTHLVADKSYCEDGAENYRVGWALKSETSGLEPHMVIPESTVFEEPSGNVEVTQL